MSDGKKERPKDTTVESSEVPGAISGIKPVMEGGYVQAVEKKRFETEKELSGPCGFGC